MNNAKKICLSSRMKRLYLYLSDKPKLMIFLCSAYSLLFSRRIKKKIKGRGNRILHKQSLLKRVTFNIVGNDNIVEFGIACLMQDIVINIRGSHNHIKLGNEVRFNLGGSIYCEDSKSCIYISDKTTFESVHLAAIEGSVIEIGRDCMFATNIEVRTGDSHSILDCESGERINPSKDVVIKDHVWVGAGVKILKGVEIGTDVVIGTGSLVTRDVPENSVAVGNPAKVVKSNVSWDRLRL